MWVWPLGQEDPLEEEMATHSSILAWRIPWTEEPGGLQSMGSQRLAQDLGTSAQKTPLMNSMKLLLVLSFFWQDFLRRELNVHRLATGKEEENFILVLKIPSVKPSSALEIISSIQFSRSAVSDSLWPHEPQHARPPSPSPTTRAPQTHVHWIRDAIQPSHPLSSPSPPDLNLSQHQGLFKWISSSHQVAKGLEFQLQHQSFQWTPWTDLLEDGLVGSPCSPRDSQESSPTPQFKGIHSSALSLLYGLTLTSIHDRWKNRSLD